MSQTLAECLKNGTRELHDAAETHPFQYYLTTGMLPLDIYAQYLSQLFLIHSSLEETIRNTQSLSHLTAVIPPAHYQENFLKKDLAALGIEPSSIKSLEPTERFLAYLSSLGEQQPESLLGPHYVLFGSKHGGKFIAHNLRSRHGFQECGVMYFDPYGSNFRSYWLQFIQEMNTSELLNGKSERILEAAKATFKAVREIGDRIWQQHSERLIAEVVVNG